MLIAHRGNDNHKYLENTKEAVIYCLNKEYIDGIEIDIRVTKDKEFVLSHNMLIDKKIRELRKIIKGLENAKTPDYSEIDYYKNLLGEIEKL